MLVAMTFVCGFKVRMDGGRMDLFILSRTEATLLGAPQVSHQRLPPLPCLIANAARTPGQTWEFQVATIGDHGALSDFTGITSAACDPDTAAGPSNIITQPSGSNAISFTWDAVSGYSINRYEVIVWDEDTEGAFINGFSTTGTSYTVSGLLAGHHYGCWVTTWVNLPDGNIGGGPPASAREVIVGQGVPGLPVGLTVTNIDATTVQLSWDSAYGAAGYSVQYQSLINASDVGIDGTTQDTTYQIGFLYPGTWHYEFCVHAYNGNSESACTAYVTPPVYPGFSKRALLEANITAAETKTNEGLKFVKDNKLQTLWKLRQQSVLNAVPQQNLTNLIPF